MKYLIILSSKYAPPELASFGKIPMVLYPVNNGTILDLILKQYDDSYKVVVVSYEGYEKVVNSVKTIKDHDVDVLKLDKLDDLQYSILKAFEYINPKTDDEVVINFGDTIIKNKTISPDTIVVSHPNGQAIDNRWSYLKHNNGVVLDIIDKKNKSVANLEDYFIVCGVFSVSCPNEFLDIMKRNWLEKKNLFESLAEYSKSHHFNFIEAVDWFDLGHDSEYFNSGLAIKSREFNHIQIDKNRGILEKKSDHFTKFKHEILWYLNIPKELSYVTPRIFDYSLDKNNLFVKMEYYSYTTLLELFLYGDLSDDSWKRIIDKLAFVLNDFSRFTYSDDKIQKSLFEMYCSKTVNRLSELKNNEAFVHFFEHTIKVNGVEYVCLNYVLDNLGNWVNERLLNIKTFCVIHGDLCFSNILIDNKFNFLKLIDPRGVFGEHFIYGDNRYDMAKLFHSVDGKYDLIIKNLFEIKTNDNSIEINFLKSNNNILSYLKHAFETLPNYSLDEVEFIEALLFLSMIPLHKENINHQYAMLAVGLQILNRQFNIEVKKNGQTK